MAVRSDHCNFSQQIMRLFSSQAGLISVIQNYPGSGNRQSWSVSGLKEVMQKYC
jgi:hypothetical protein